ncbi:carboxypeptidase-like regulatory domain-containing protein [Herbaspirillum sp. ST 5-3]|uniref:carboxypeptidase-like regulatory domain-containing protein n=1 Tax=Oxalobacteraceae TaxID=75682 RepID=UPI0010A49C0C|nr:carboxypeptidase-like regulatory domain-containing protein [Herbaspirillum sp. ST 5-3]
MPEIRQKLLGSIICTPPTAAIGESVCVEVRAPDGHAYDNTETVPISINGVPGSRQYLVWNRAGMKNIRVVAGTRGHIEKMNASVQITVPVDGKQPPLLQVRTSPDQPTRLRLSLLHTAPPKTTGRPVGKRPLSQVPGAPVVKPLAAPAIKPVIRAQTIVSATAHVATAAPKPARIPVSFGGGLTQPVYSWSLGTNILLGTTNPSVEHDFGPQLDPNRPYSVFHVKATVQSPGEAPRIIQRSVTVTNPYYLTKQRGVLQPAVVDSDLSAFFVDGAYRASFTVFNPEPVDMTLTSWQLELNYDDAPREFEMKLPIATSVVLKAKTQTRINVAIPNNQLPKQATAFTVHYKGKGPNNLPVRVAAHFDVPQHMHKKFLVDLAAQSVLDNLVVKGLVANPKSISFTEVAQLARHDMLEASPSTAGARLNLNASSVLQALKPTLARPLDAHMPAPFPVEGEECDPWNLPDHIPEGMYCVPTQEKRWVQMPARFMNAKKGDLILSPGNGSLISSVLMTVTPPQRFSHSGIMTRNRDEITHSTASEDRLSSFVGADGARPDVLKYLWPGVITQTIEHAVNGEDFVDPETGKTYNLSGFGTIESKMDLGGVASELVPMMVVKPDPLNETPELRQKLHGIADFAAQQAGKSHYRFFCYTDPKVGLIDKAPAEAKWAANTFPTVCSSLIWMSIRQSGAQIEGALEQSDLARGAQIVPSTPDGLYLYQADERLAAGEVLFDRVKEIVLESTSSFADFLTDVSDDFANQILNTFASDWADTDSKDSDKWRQTGDANAVSPENLTFYDTPLYGYMEPVIYRPARWEQVTIYRWKKVVQTGTIKGVVRFQGKPMAGVNVQISENQFTHTAADGSFTLTGVPVGKVLIDAQKVDGSGNNLTAEVSTNVAANQTSSVTIDLQLPSHLFRRITIDGWMSTTDYEFAAAAYPHSVGDFYGVAQLGPDSSTHVVKHFDRTADDAMGRLILTFDLLDKDVVQVKATIRCYDSSTDDTDDYDEWKLDPFVLKPGQSGTWWLWVEGDNYAEAHFTLTNKVDQS